MDGGCFFPAPERLDLCPGMDRAEPRPQHCSQGAHSRETSSQKQGATVFTGEKTNAMKAQVEVLV